MCSGPNSKVVNKGKLSLNEEQEIDLYIGIFFDGTNNNKYQTMLGKFFRRKEILAEIVRSANSGDLSTEQIKMLLFAKPKPVIKEAILSSIGPGEGYRGYSRQIKIFQANISPNELTNNYSRIMWKYGKRKNGSKGILSKSQIDHLYFGYENNEEEDVNFIEKHIQTTLELSPESHTLSSVAESFLEKNLLKVAVCDFVEGTENIKDVKDMKGAFAQDNTYTNVAILESLYNLESASEAEQHFSIYVEGSGADMVILPWLNKTYRKKADTLALATKCLAKVTSQLFNTTTIDILESLFECGVDILTPKLLPKVLDRIDDIVGLGFGVGPTGVVSKSRKAAELIKKIIYKHSGQKIKLHFDIFGFSRGSTTARMLNYAIDACKNNVKKDAGRVIEEDIQLISGYPRFVKINKKIISKEVRLIGIFDTVSSIGVYRNGQFLNEYLAKKIKNESEMFKNRDKEPYHDRNVDDFGLFATDQAQEVVHICALDEVRQNFALVDIESSIIAKNGLELFIPGCHTDIGGGASIGREGAKIVNLNSYQGVRNYFCIDNSTSYNDMTYKPVSAENFQKTGWLDNSQETEDKSISGRPNEDRLADSDDTIYTDNANNWHTRNNIIMNRYVKPGYSNVALSLMHKKGGDRIFKCIPLSYAIPDDLIDYYSELERYINEKGRFFANPSKASYYSLRNKYLHLSANDQLMAFADNLLVNPPAYSFANVNSSTKDETIVGSSLEIISRDHSNANTASKVDEKSIRLASRIIYHGVKKENSSGSGVTYMFDYKEKGFDVQCKRLMAEIRDKLQKEKDHLEEYIESVANEAETYGVLMKEKNNKRQSTYLFNKKRESERQMGEKEKEWNNIINILNDFPKT